MCYLLTLTMVLAYVIGLARVMVSAVVILLVCIIVLPRVMVLDVLWFYLSTLIMV